MLNYALVFHVVVVHVIVAACCVFCFVEFGSLFSVIVSVLHKTVFIAGFIFNASSPCLVFVFLLLLLLFSFALVVANNAIYLLALHMRHPVDQTAEQIVL